MLRVLLLQDRQLNGGGLGALLGRDEGIAVVGNIDFEGDVALLATGLCPDVIVINTDYMVSQVLPVVAELKARSPRSALLILADPSKPGMLPPRRRDGGLSFLPKDTPLPILANAIRRAARGEQVIDQRLTLAAIGTEKEISTRELEVLGLAAEGDSVADIARRLYLSLGTVRNYISSAIMKTGARNRMDAIRIVRKDGWLR